MGEGLAHTGGVFPTLTETSRKEERERRSGIKGHRTVCLVSHFTEEVVVCGYSPFVEAV